MEEAQISVSPTAYLPSVCGLKAKPTLEQQLKHVIMSNGIHRKRLVNNLKLC